jgi:hypothetical protein
VAYERSISMDVFVSHYFKEDQTNFNNICYAFQQEGIEAWNTDEINAGEPLRDRIQDAIKSCSVCVFIATSKSLESGWCRAEIGAFWGARKPVVVYAAGDERSEAVVPEQFKGDKWASTIKEVVTAVKRYLAEAAKNQDTGGLESRRREAEAVYCLAID